MTKLSISVVCFQSPQSHLRDLMDSLLVSIETLRRYHDVSTIPLFIVDNSDEAGASFDLFVERSDAFRDLEVELRHLAGHGNIGYGAAHNRRLHR